MVLTQQCKKAYVELVDILDEWSEQLRSHLPKTHVCRVERQNDFTANFQSGFYICSIVQKCFGPANSGTEPGIVLYLPSNRTLELMPISQAQDVVWMNRDSSRTVGTSRQLAKKILDWSEQ
ncbi:MAG: hypothetical protein K2W95_36520 [Candidatus Obscuribacterales bacterium]|nr:hypothetical protein [Candidatus Obscuribacterales bacterium]